MKKNLLFLLFLFIYGFSMGQSVRINISVNAENADPPLGTAVLYQLPDSNMISTKTITTSQFFVVEMQGLYLLKFSSAGMLTIYQPVVVKDAVTEITINWMPLSVELDAVTVRSRKPLITQEDDKTIIDAEVLADASTNAYEVLEKTPGAVVDQDGNVYLNSATPARIQINGRDIRLGAADLASLLKSLPANSIIKVEILRTPSAKYDASSSGGIVNIVLKKGVKLGTNGSVNTGVFQGKLNTTTAGFNLNRNVGKIGSRFSYQFTDRNNFEELTSTRLLNADNALLSQTAYTTYPSLIHYLGTGIDAEISEKWSVGYDVSLSANNRKSFAQNDIDINSLNNNELKGRNQSVISNSGPSYYLGNNIYAKKKIDSLGSEWTIDLEYNYYDNKNQQDYINSITVPFMNEINGTGDTKNKKYILSFESDLILKLKNKYTLETGGKFNNSNSRNNTLYFQDRGSGPKLDSFQTNNFRYQEQISSVYVQASKTFFGFTIKPGIRLEHTDIQGNQLFPSDTSLQIKRTDLFPYVYLRHRIAKLFGFTLNGNLVYRRSISRPYYEALNPYPKYIDQYLFEVGNPDLRPQFTSNYEFNIMADQFPVFSAGINDVRDIFTNVTYQDEATKIAYRTYDNLGRNKEFYLRMVGGIPPGGKYFFYTGAQHNFVKYEGLYQGLPFNYKRGTWTFFMYHNYKPTPTFNITVNGFMRVKGIFSFYELKSFGQLNVSLNKTVFNKKMNIILSGNDILQTNNYSFDIAQPGITAAGTRFNDSRRVGLTLRYNFGIKPKEEKKPMYDIQEPKVNM